MQIPLKIQKIAGGDRLVLTVMIKVSRFVRTINAIIDTGSPKSILCNTDFQLMKMPHNILIDAEQKIDIGSQKGVVLYKINKPINLIIINKEKKPFEIEYPIFIAPSHQTPTIFGVDFLTKNNYVLHYDAANKIGYLDDVPLTTN